MTWLRSIAETVARDGAAARAVIVATHGPTPRAVGAAMLVSCTGRHEGKIGRPEVEARVLAEAQSLMARAARAALGQPSWLRRRLQIETGKVLGEPTGGTVVLLLEAFGPAELAQLSRLAQPPPQRGAAVARTAVSGAALQMLAPGEDAVVALRVPLAALSQDPQLALQVVTSADGHETIVERLVPEPNPLVVYGTGLVARALVKVACDLPLAVEWLDTSPGHFPAVIPPGVSVRALADPAVPARSARPGSLHAVMTSDHDLDLGICRAVLSVGTFAYLGVIGSRLKRERLAARLAAEGFSDTEIARVACPIGLPQLRSKVPAVIAVGIAAQMMIALQDAAAGSNA